MADASAYYDQFGLQDVVPPEDGALGIDPVKPKKPNALLAALKSRGQNRNNYTSGNRETLSSDQQVGSNLGSFAANLFPSLTQLRKGALVSKPTIALVGEAGPEAVIPLSKPEADQDDQLERYQGLARRKFGSGGMPESPDTIRVQLEQLTGGARKAVLIAEGADIPSRPKGIRQVRTKEGVIYYNPDEVTPEEIHAASHGNSLSDLLGDADLGYGSAPKEELDEPVLSVSAVTKSKVPVQDVATDRYHLPRTLKASRKMVPHGGAIIVQSPAEAIQARLKSHKSPMPKMAEGGYEDDPTPSLVGEAGPEARIPLSGNDDEDLKLLDQYRRMAAGDPQRKEHLKTLENELANRRPNYAPDKPKWWQYLAAGGIGAIGGLNDSSPHNRHIDVSQGQQNVLYPGLATKKAEYEGDTKRLEDAYAKERQAQQDETGNLQKAAALENIASNIHNRIDTRRENAQKERDTFAAKGGRFVPPQSTGYQGPPQVELPGQPPTPEAPEGPPQVEAPGGMQLPEPAKPPSVIITGGKVGMSGQVPQNPEGYVDTPTGPYDPKGSRRIVPTSEYVNKMKMDAQQSKIDAEVEKEKKLWPMVTDSLAKALPNVGIEAGTKVPEKTMDALIRAAEDKAHNPTLEFDKVTNEVTGDRTISGFDSRTGEKKSLFVIPGAGQKRAPQPSVASIQFNATQDSANVEYWAKKVSDDPKNLSFISKDSGLTKAVRDKLAGSGYNLNQMDASTRDMAVLAKQGLGHVDAIQQLITAMEQKGKLGPIMSRWNEFMSGKVGTGDPEYAKLRDNILLLDTLMGRVHGGARGAASPSMLAHIKSMVNAGTMDPSILRSGVDTFKEWLGSYADMAKAEPPTVGGAAPQAGPVNTPNQVAPPPYTQKMVDDAARQFGLNPQEVEAQFKAAGRQKQ